MCDHANGLDQEHHEDEDLTIYYCRNCGMSFVSATDYDRAAVQHSAALDALAGATAAVLWDLHQRAIAQHSPEVAAAVRPEAVAKVAGSEPVQNTCAEGHAYQGGFCANCGESIFLGGEKGQ